MMPLVVKDDGRLFFVENFQTKSVFLKQRWNGEKKMFYSVAGIDCDCIY